MWKGQLDTPVSPAYNGVQRSIQEECYVHPTGDYVRSPGEAGLQDDSEGEVVIFRKDPRRKFGQGEYITKIAARDFTGYDVIARFGPGDYIVRYMLNGRYQPGGYAEVSISREAAIEAGWNPEEDKKDNSQQQQQPGTTVQQYIPEAIWNEIQAMREDLRVERQTKDAWLQAIIEKLGERKDDSMNSMIATLLAVMQSSN